MIRTLSTISAIGLCSLSFSSTAFAWEHHGWVWAPDSMPINYQVSYCNEPDPKDPNDCQVVGEDSIGGAYVDLDGNVVAKDTTDAQPFEVWVSQAGFNAWSEAPCTELTTEFGGTFDDNFGYENWTTPMITWEDPSDDLATGVLAATLTYPYSLSQGDTAFTKNGMSYYKAEDSDIVFNDNVEFGIDSTLGQGESSMQSVMTHEIGHLLGLAHSCEEEDVCNDQGLKEATMYWSAGPGDDSGSTLSDDDFMSVMALYGPFATFSCSNELDPDDSDTIAQGNVPFDLRCAVVTDEEGGLTGATWNWGDGSSDTTGGDANISHTYEVAGNYTVETVFTGERDSCEEEWEYAYRRIGYVRACDVPQPEFKVVHEDGLEYTLFNETDVSVYGCIYEIQWDIFQGDTLVDSFSGWEPNYVFAEDGDYRIVLNIGGPAGTGAAEISLEVYDHVGEGYGCSSLGGLTGSMGLVLIVGTIATRRRREA